MATFLKILSVNCNMLYYGAPMLCVVPFLLVPNGGVPNGWEMAGCQMAECQMAGCQLAECQMAGCQLAECQITVHPFYGLGQIILAQYKLMNMNIIVT